MNSYLVKFNDGREDKTIAADSFVPHSGVYYFQKDDKYIAMYEKEVVKEIELIE